MRAFASLLALAHIGTPSKACQCDYASLLIVRQGAAFIEPRMAKPATFIDPALAEDGSECSLPPKKAIKPEFELSRG